MKRRKSKRSLISRSSAIAFLIGVFVALVAVIVAPSSSISNLSGMALSTIPQRTCTDSDDGIETEQPGIVRLRLEGVVFQKFVDRCISGRPYKIEEGALFVCVLRALSFKNLLIAASLAGLIRLRKGYAIIAHSSARMRCSAHLAQPVLSLRMYLHHVSAASMGDKMGWKKASIAAVFVRRSVMLSCQISDRYLNSILSSGTYEAYSYYQKRRTSICCAVS